MTLLDLHDIGYIFTDFSLIWVIFLSRLDVSRENMTRINEKSVKTFSSLGRGLELRSEKSDFDRFRTIWRHDYDS